jgi:hypothetical protein
MCGTRQCVDFDFTVQSLETARERVLKREAGSTLQISSIFMLSRSIENGQHLFYEGFVTSRPPKAARK